MMKMLIKSKRKTILTTDDKSPAIYKLDKYQSWEYAGWSEKTGVKYKSHNAVTNQSSYKTSSPHTGVDLNDA